LSRDREIERMEQEKKRVDQKRKEVDQKRTGMERQQAEMEQREAATLEKGVAKGLIGQVRLCEQFLHRTPLPDEQLIAMSVDQLRELVDQLRSQAAS
jgi:hypothetical protein